MGSRGFSSSRVPHHSNIPPFHHSLMALGMGPKNSYNQVVIIPKHLIIKHPVLIFKAFCTF